MIGTIQDITEKKAIEKTLKKWEQTFQHAEWGIVISDLESSTLGMTNPAFAKMLGYETEDITKMSIDNVFAPESRKTGLEQIKKAQSTNYYEYESSLLRKDGSTFPVFISVTVVPETEKTGAYRIINIQDITERKEAETVEKDLERLNTLRLLSS